jgi:ribosomal protein S18 acetylase RimI-like enzyme
MAVNFTLRPFSAEDQDFLFQLYADTRQEEVSAFGWPAAQQEMFLRMQFNAQQRWYGMAYPGADHQLILLESEPAGRIMVFREQEANRLVDIALLSRFRGRGIGGQLLQALIDQSGKQGLAVRLQVLKTNRARHLYHRSGFVETGDDGLYLQMERKPEETE